MNILILLAAVIVAVYGEICDENITTQYIDEIKQLESCEACKYMFRFVTESKKLKKLELIHLHKNDENYKLKSDVSLNLT